MNIICLGDSIMQSNKEDTYPQAGWPDAFRDVLAGPCIKVLNFALNGRSTKSFIDEGQFDKARYAAFPEDTVLISFGHNDEKEDPLRHTDPNGSYKRNLSLMANAFLLKGCHPILISSFSRLLYDSNGVLIHSHGEYPKAMKEVAEELDIPFIDLEQISYDYLSKHSFEENSKFYMCFGPNIYPNYPEGKKDTSHLSQEGAKFVVGLVSQEMKKIPEVGHIIR